MDATSLISSGVGTIATLVSSIDSAKEQRRLQEKLAKLSLQQQKDLALSLQQTQGEVQKMALLYQTLNLDRDRSATSELNKQKFIGISILGISVVILAVVIYKAKQNG